MTKPGRPRPLDAIWRDEQVLKTLQAYGRSTRNEVARRLRIEPYLVYLSLARLREQRKVRRPDVHGYRNHWEIRDDE